MQKEQRQKRHSKIRAKIFGTSQRPRLFVFRSNQHTYASLIDDTSGTTLAAVSDKAFKGIPKTEAASNVGKTLATKATELGVKEVVFDRGGYLYHGRVKAVAEGARMGGLKF